MQKAWFNFPVLSAAALSLAATAVISALVFAEREAPPTQLLDEPWAVPAFTVTDHMGRTLTRDDLLGEVWVCDFFLTRCNGVCPVLAHTMAGLTQRLEEDGSLDGVRLVSFSVEPAHDTVEALRAYRQKHIGAWDGGSDALRETINARWVHARAEDQDAFWSLVKSGFKLHVGGVEGDPTTPVAHSSKLVLVGRDGRIRGYYEGMTTDELPALLADIRRLVADPD